MQVGISHLRISCYLVELYRDGFAVRSSCHKLKAATQPFHPQSTLERRG
jgi:hypothetical protein